MPDRLKQGSCDPQPGPVKPDANAVLARLQEGNARFVKGQPEFAQVDHHRRALAAKADQKDHALATVVACSDSRVPVESIFDARLMELFVVRVAGGVVRRAQTASIEYGLLHVQTPLLVVLGHSDCGAVNAALSYTRHEGAVSKDNVDQLLDSIVPAINRAQLAEPDADPEALARRAVLENVWQSIEDLFQSSPAVCSLVQEGKTKVVGAVYDLTTNRVDWLDMGEVDRIMEQVQLDLSSLLAPWDGEEASHSHLRAHVLVVDDELDFLDSVSERLNLRGFDVDTVDSGQGALDKIEVHRYDTIIMDISMPGLDGMETLKRAMAKNSDLQIVLLTGHATLRLGVEAMKLGALDFIEKPADIGLLVEKIMEGKDRRLQIDAAAREKALRDAIERYGW